MHSHLHQYRRILLASLPGRLHRLAQRHSTRSFLRRYFLIGSLLFDICQLNRFIGPILHTSTYFIQRIRSQRSECYHCTSTRFGTTSIDDSTVASSRSSSQYSPNDIQPEDTFITKSHIQFETDAASKSHAREQLQSQIPSRRSSDAIGLLFDSSCPATKYPYRLYKHSNKHGNVFSVTFNQTREFWECCGIFQISSTK